MASTGTSLRTPLLWLLLPFMAGIAIGDSYSPGRAWLAVLAGLAATLGVVAMVLALIRHPGIHWLALAAVAGAALLSGWVSLVGRTQPLAGWETTPREVTVTLQVEQSFTSPPHRKTFGGLGRVVAADVHVASLVGQRVYFSAIRKISVPVARSGLYAMRGVIEARPSNGDDGFDRYLDGLGIRLTLTRAHFLREERPPGGFQRFCARTEARFEAMLGRGLESHPGLVSLYLGMLLGEKAVLTTDQQNAFMRSGTFHILSFLLLPLLLATPLVTQYPTPHSESPDTVSIIRMSVPHTLLNFYKKSADHIS